MIGEMLGKTLAEVDAMPHNEYHQWRAFIVYRTEMLKLAQTAVPSG